MTTLGLALITETSQSWGVYIFSRSPTSRGMFRVREKSSKDWALAGRRKVANVVEGPVYINKFVYFTSLSVVLSLYSLCNSIDSNS